MKSFMKKITQGLLLVPALVLGLGVLAPATTFAADGTTCEDGSLSISCGANSARGSDQPDKLFGEDAVFQTIVNILLFIIGAVAVIMLIIGGIRYVVSGGDQNAVTGAKNTILYAVIGIVVAVLAYAVVNFVITELPGGGGS